MITDVRKLFLFLQSVRYFFEDKECSRVELYRSMRRLSVSLDSEDSSGYLISPESSASERLIPCIEQQSRTVDCNR